MVARVQAARKVVEAEEEASTEAEVAGRVSMLAVAVVARHTITPPPHIMG
jgi:hypothetical protein